MKQKVLKCYKLMAIPTILYGYESWIFTERHKFEALEMHFLRAMSLYRLIEHRHNEDIWEELQTVDIN
jgi:hypothetical protein